MPCTSKYFYLPDTNIVLIGLPLSGKTTAAKELARLTGKTALDTDALIERAESRSVSEIFALFGEDVFRAKETEALARAVKTPNVIISAGGGVVEKLENRAVMQGCCVIYLFASPQILADRADGSRPLLRENSARKLRELYEKRRAAYESWSDKTIDTKGKTPLQIADEIFAFLSRKGI